MLGAGVGQRDAIAQAGGVEPVAGKELGVKAVEILDGRMRDEELGDLIEGGSPFAKGMSGGGNLAIVRFSICLSSSRTLSVRSFANRFR